MVRILSGYVMVLAVLGLLFAGRAGVYALVLIIGGAALWEFRQLSRHMGLLAPAWLIFPAGALFAFGGTLLPAVGIDLVLGAVLVIGLAVFLFLPGPGQALGRWALGVAGAVYIGLPFHFYLLLYSSHSADPLKGVAWVLFTILAVVMTDVGALLVGSRLGRNRFFSTISPRKTVEGAIGGIVLAIPVMVFGGFGVLGLSAVEAILLAILVAVSAEIGDLVESQMKRTAGVKDSSRLIPGHGGVLDRIDSVLFPPVIVYFFASFLHLL